MKIKDILRKKNLGIISVSPETSGYRALELMASHEIGALPVIDRDNIIGLFTERDYARKCILEDRSSKKTPVSKMMNEDLHFITKDFTVDVCIGLMAEYKVRYLMVLEDSKLTGVISISDLLNSVIREKDSVIDFLETYIAGSPDSAAPFI